VTGVLWGDFAKISLFKGFGRLGARVQV
jgi:hypothetical protein